MKFLLPALLILLASCASPTSDADRFDLPILDIEHAMEISESDDLLLGSITNLLVDSDGDIILIDGSQRFVYAVNSAGDFIQQIGGRGSGPGEYQFPGPTALSEDNKLHLFDFSTRTMITYAKENGQWDYHSDFAASFNEYGFFSLFFPAANDEFFVVTNPMQLDSDGKAIVRKIDNSGKVVQDSVYTYPQNERFTITENGMPRMSMTLPSMHRQGRFNVDYNGNLYFGWTDSLTIFRQKVSDSNFEPVINISVNNLPFTAAARDTILSNYENMLSDNNQARRDLISSFPDTKPIYSDYKVDDQSRIWVQMFNDEEDTEWIVFSDEGEPLYEVSLPGKNRLRTIRHGNIYAVEMTEEGIPVVNIFKINS